MDVILKQEIDLLGSVNDIVKVKNGYGRNFLIPKGMAVLATPSMKKVMAENVKQQAHKATKVKSEAEAIAVKLEGMTLKIGAKAGESGKIFGSVNTIQLAEAMAKKGFEIDRKKITIKEEPIKNLGSYTATIKLHKEVTKEINFEVIEE